MKANELRIGNWLNDFANEPHQVIHLTKDKTILETPIPLTEDWLLKFGLMKFKTETGLLYSTFYSDIREFRIYWPQNNRVMSLHCRPDATEWFPDLVRNIQYVHQLQNLYFALTGNELTIEP